MVYVEIKDELLNPIAKDPTLEDEASWDGEAIPLAQGEEDWDGGTHDQSSPLTTTTDDNYQDKEEVKRWGVGYQ